MAIESSRHVTIPTFVLASCSLAAVVLTGASGLWTVFQSQLAAQEKAENDRHAHITARENELRQEIIRIKDELLPKLVLKDAMNEFQKSADDRWKTQADINRQAIDAYLTSRAFFAWKDERDKTIEQLMSRIRRLEDRTLQPRELPSVNRP